VVQRWYCRVARCRVFRPTGGALTSRAHWFRMVEHSLRTTRVGRAAHGLGGPKSKLRAVYVMPSVAANGRFDHVQRAPECLPPGVDGPLTAASTGRARPTRQHHPAPRPHGGRDRRRDMQARRNLERCWPAGAGYDGCTTDRPVAATLSGGESGPPPMRLHVLLLRPPSALCLQAAWWVRAAGVGGRRERTRRHAGRQAWATYDVRGTFDVAVKRRGHTS
jgi:hypothetical protein